MILPIPVRFNRGQAMSLWSLMAELTLDAQVDIFEQRGDGEIWVEASNDIGVARYRLPASGGHFRVDSASGDDATESPGPEANIGDDGDVV